MTASVPLWVPFATAAVGAAATFLGSFMAPLTQRLLHRDQLMEARKALLRAKAEAIYEEFDRVLDLTTAARLDAVNRMYGPVEGPTPSAINAGRLKALITMYFPSAEPILSRYDDRSLEAVPLGQTDLIEDEADEDRLKRMKENRHKFVEAVARATYDMVGEMRRHMNEEVRRLL